MGMGERKGRRIGGEGDCEGACERKRENKSKKQTHTERESEIETYCTYPPLPPAPLHSLRAYLERPHNGRLGVE